ncbi:MAG: MoaD/ThiS family protein [Betaproteobacteria bacterium]
MQITIKLYATLGDYLPPGSKHNHVVAEVADNATVTAALAPFALPPKLTHLVLINGVFIPPKERAATCLKPGDTLAVWPPIAGG